jgi:hypothetical protein
MKFASLRVIIIMIPVSSKETTEKASLNIKMLHVWCHFSKIWQAMEIDSVSLKNGF